MSTATQNGAGAAGATERKRRGRPTGGNDEQAKVRFFSGEMTEHGVSLTREFRTEPEAQLESLKQDQPYFAVQAWKATPDLNNGTIAVVKRPFAKL